MCRVLPLLLLFVHSAVCRIHHLPVLSDTRLYIDVTNFAFLRGAYFNVEISNFTFNIPSKHQIGFTFSKGNAMEDIVKNIPQICPLLIGEDSEDYKLDNAVFFFFNFPNKSLDIVRRGSALEKLEICTPLDIEHGMCSSDFANSASAVHSKMNKDPTSKSETNATSKSGMENMKDGNGTSATDDVSSGSKGMMKNRSTRSTSKDIKSQSGNEMYEMEIGAKPISLVNYLPLTYENKEYYTKFSIRFWHPVEEGEYFFYFHNCHNYKVDYSDREPVTFNIYIVEKNSFSFLPAGEIVKPKLYFGLALMFLITALFWVYLLRSNRDNIYKIHYLMAALVFIKALSLFFHGVNFYFISILGKQQEAWAVVYYIMHLLKGALLFGTIILIGTGWTFFKNFLTDRDRRLFMVIIPLQVIDNIAMVIFLESEEGERHYRFWWQLFILVDLLCCAAIILPVIWSIRHLQEASETDGKAAFNLKKLKLFRHFYIIIIVYIYTTRILHHLISFVVPFQYEWLLVVVEEIGAWLFYVVTGYKFRPATNNPYLRLAQSDDESDTDTALTQSGALEGVVRVNVPSGRSRRGKGDPDQEQETSLLAEHSLEHD